MSESLFMLKLTLSLLGVGWLSWVHLPHQRIFEELAIHVRGARASWLCLMHGVRRVDSRCKFH